MKDKLNIDNGLLALKKRTPGGNKGLAQLLVLSVFVRSVLLIKFVAGLTVKCFKNRNMCQASIVSKHKEKATVKVGNLL